MGRVVVAEGKTEGEVNIDCMTNTFRSMTTVGVERLVQSIRKDRTIGRGQQRATEVDHRTYHLGIAISIVHRFSVNNKII